MKFQVLAILYGFSRECLAIEADTSLSGYRVVGVLERLAEIRGPPEAILADMEQDLLSGEYHHTGVRYYHGPHGGLAATP